MATVPYPFPFCSAATYPPPSFPGGYYSAPPAFPYAYLPPASAYAPPPGFFPAPAYGLSTFPFAATSYPPDFSSFPSESSCLTHEATPIPTEVDQNQPPPAPTPELPTNSPIKPLPVSASCPAEDNGATPRYTGATFQIEQSGDVCQPTMPDYTCQGRDRTMGNITSSSEPLSMVNASLNHALDLLPPRPLSLDPSTSSPSIDLSSSKVAFHTSASRMLPDRSPAATDLFLVQPSFDAIQDQFAKITSMLSQLAASLGRTQKVTSAGAAASVVCGSSASSTNTAGSTSTRTSSSRVFSATSMSPSASTGYVAPHIFGEMPTTASAPSFGFTPSSGSKATTSTTVPATATSASTVPSATAHDASAVLGEMPQSYGLHNLERQTVILADGTEQNYFALPTNYPWERAVPEPVFDVCDDESDGYSNEFISAFTRTPEQQTCEEEQQESPESRKCFSRPSENPLPEVSEYTLTDNVGVSIARYIKFTHGQCIPQVLEYAYTPGCAMGDILLKDYKWNMSFSEEAREIWDPGASASLHISQAEPPRELSYVAIGFPKVLNLCNQVGTHVQQLRDPCWNVLVTSERREEWDSGDHSILNSTLNRDMLAVASCVSQQIYCTVPPSQENSEIQFEWDPGILSIMDMMLGKTTGPNGVHSGQKPCKLLIFIGQPVDLKQFWAQLLLLSHSWYNTTNVCLQVLYCCLQVVLACPYLVPVCYSRMFSSTEAIHSAISMSNATTVHMILVLSSGKIAEEENDAVAMYQVFEIQFPMSKASHIWDPGYFFVPARLLPTQISTHAPNNTELGEFTSRCRSLRQQGIKKSYNAKNLLSSPNYLHILEMEILFITFLPP